MDETEGKVLKCPVAQKISLAKDCFDCENLLQINFTKGIVECDIDFKQMYSNLFDPNDPKVAEL